MFQDLHVVDFHAHFPVRGDVSTSRGGPRRYTAGSPAAEQAEYMRAQAERYRAAWRPAWDFPQPEPEPGPEQGDEAVDAMADRWLAELDRYGVDRIGFATGGGNDTLAPPLPRPPHPALCLRPPQPTPP